jgi:hypothetical protein
MTARKTVSDWPLAGAPTMAAMTAVSANASWRSKLIIASIEIGAPKRGCTPDRPQIRQPVRRQVKA